MREAFRGRPQDRRSRGRNEPWLAGALRTPDVLVGSAFVVFCAAVLLPTWREDTMGRALAWASALVVVAVLLAFPRSRQPGYRQVARDLGRERAFDVAPSPARRGHHGPRRSTETWHGRHGHSGERPRFD